MLSTKSIYALKAMVYIAINSNKSEYITIKDIANSENISQKYLEQVISLLVRGNLLFSYRGFNGGYKLTKRIDEYNAYEIICASDKDLCNSNLDNQGWVKSFFDDFNNNTRNYLKGITLDDLINYYNKENNIFDYCI